MIELARDLVADWKAKADELEQLGAPGPAKAFRRCAQDLLVRIREYLDEELTLTQAAAESRWSERFLRELVRTGKLKRAGKSPITIRREDLLAFEPNGAAVARRPVAVAE